MQKYSEKGEGNEIKVNEEILNKIASNDKIDSLYGYEEHKANYERTGWLVNMKPTDFINHENFAVSAMVYYFLEDDGNQFKAIKVFQPYFYICTRKDTESIVENELRKKYDAYLTKIEIITKEDLDLDNHLSGLKKTCIKLCFNRLEDLITVRKELLPIIKENRKKSKEESNYTALLTEHYTGTRVTNKGLGKDWVNWIIDIREYDVPYHVRVSIDLNIFVGKWYSVKGSGDFTELLPRHDLLHRPEPVVLAYDIETTKLPLKFPDSTVDQIMMISYMLDGQGYLICNREIIAEDIENFEFTPRPEFPGPFIVFNEIDERCTIERFFEHIREVKPHIFVSYNGDFFDWPFVEARAVIHGLNMLEEIGFSKDNQGEYKSRPAAHMDALQWVKRDSYLPVGSQGLKPVCKAKLRYDPVEVDPEDMVKFAREQPRTLANYSVSDAVATYYLYMRYVHPFIFALCTIIPMDPDEVLRKGSGTLCESLLMVEAFRANIIFPNKQETKLNELTRDGHLLKSETYVGGHVEALESGVFRADVATKFRVIPEMCQYLRDNLKRTLEHALTVEEKVSMDIITNFDEVVNEVESKLKDLQINPNRFETPLIYHLDVAAMYPNIILSNRLQPSAVFAAVESSMENNYFRCTACDHNVAGARCQRPMNWVWRGEVMPATRSQYYLIQTQLEKEKFPNKTNIHGPPRAWYELNRSEQAEAERERLEKLCRNEYKRRHDTRLETRTSIVCQKENSFYVDTVRAFRDRRYEFKGLTKKWKGILDNLIESGGDASEIKHANGMLVLYDSLQLAHKCILNSFYGYVMRKAARWYSMEMAGIVCHTGANIIRKAREVIEQVGRPLELDTDGVWCILPASFPEKITFTTNNPKKSKITISYPGAMLNIMVQSDFTNDQYHDLIDPTTRKYSIRSENSIFFEVDGPYLAMILPAAKEQGKKLKKRYAVFNFDGSLAELKGFEVKRNGELNLIKIFQSSVFEAFLKGSTLEEIYSSVADVANYWLDLLFTKAEYMADEELFELISERKVMSKKLEEYGGQKSTSISTAKRLAEFLGDEMVRDSGLSFKFVISRRPEGLQVTDRAIPTAIFQAEESVKKHFLKKWLKCPELENFDIREILDWNYYIERFSSNIQKIITIPAALQDVPNPIPRVPHPDWLQKRLLEKDDTFKQRRIDEMFTTITLEESRTKTAQKFGDIEDIVSIKSKKRAQPCVSMATTVANTTARNWREAMADEPIPKRGHTKQEWKLWLKYHQKKWAYQKAIRKNLVEKDCNNNEPKRKMSRITKQINLSSFVTQTRVSLNRDVWQIIQLLETNTPGIFNLWVLLDSNNNVMLHKVKLTVPRIFYVNTRMNKPNGDYYKRVKKILPRSRPALYLYEYVLPETTYLANETAIKAEFVKNEVEGVYELGVPLLFRALVRLGCLCSYDKTQFNNTNQDQQSFSLTQLRQRTTAQAPYLTVLNHSPQSPINHIFLFQYKTQPRTGIIALFFPTQSKAIFILIGANVVSGNTPTSQQISAMLNRDKTDLLQSSQSTTATTPTPTPTTQINTIDVITDPYEHAAFKRINGYLLTYKREYKAPTMLITVSKINPTELVSNHLNAVVEFPQIPLQSPVEIDNDAFTALDWQKELVKLCLKSYLRYPHELYSQLDKARYLHIPIGNMISYQPGSDNCCDILYARHLNRHDHVMWCSSQPDPDLGGKETTDRRLMLLDDAMSGGLVNKDNPGMYRGVCVAFELSYVPMNTLIAMPKIHELDGELGANIGGNIRNMLEVSNTANTVDMDEQQQLSSDPRLRNLNIGNPSTCCYDDTQAAAPAFRILRTMLMSWVEDVSKFHNRIADELIVNLFRWLRSNSALMYEPALIRSLVRLTSRLMCRLIDWLGGFGLKIVHASCSRLLLATGKNKVEDALLLVQQAQSTLRETELFAALELQFLGAWDLLLWHDSHNFSGIVSDLAPTLITKQPETSNSYQSTPPPMYLQPQADSEQLEIRWHLQRYIAPSKQHPLQISFSEIIRYYLINLGKIINDEILLNSSATQDGSKSAQIRIEQFINDDMSMFIYNTISELSKMSSRINRSVQLNDFMSDKDSLPLLPLVKEQIDCPVGEFVKTLCFILSLDDKCVSQVYSWKRNMLKLFGISECVESFCWTSPYSSYLAYDNADEMCLIKSLKQQSGVDSNYDDTDLLIVLPEMMCDHCFVIRDLDLCRHASCIVTSGLDSDDNNNVVTKRTWWFVCSSCEGDLNHSTIENGLINQINGMIESALLQDMRCSKCHEIVESCLARADNCVRCGHSIETSLDSQVSLCAKLKVYRDIGRLFQLNFVEAFANTLLTEVY